MLTLILLTTLFILHSKQKILFKQPSYLLGSIFDGYLNQYHHVIGHTFNGNHLPITWESSDE